MPAWPLAPARLLPAERHYRDFGRRAILLRFLADASRRDAAKIRGLASPGRFEPLRLLRDWRDAGGATRRHDESSAFRLAAGALAAVAGCATIAVCALLAHAPMILGDATPRLYEHGR